MKRFELYFKIPGMTNWYYWGRYESRPGAIAAKDYAGKLISATMAEIVDRSDNSVSFFQGDDNEF